MKMTVCRTMRRGAVLLWAVITLAVVTTLVGAIGSYQATSMRLGREYLAANGEYYSFLYAKGNVTKAVNEAVRAANAVDQDASLGALIAGLKELKDKDYWDGDNHVKVVVDGLDELEKGPATITIKMIVYRKGSGGIEVVAKEFERSMTFMFDYDSASGLAMHPIFNYAYFANNRGHLESPNKSKIVVNGDIGSNDKFTVNGATVNGYIWAHANANGQNAVELLGTPHIWTYANYLRRVVKEYTSNSQESYTQVRPTNPIMHNGEFVEWPGGYEAFGDFGDFVTVGDDGSVSYNYPGDEQGKKLKAEVARLTSITVEEAGVKPYAKAMPLPTDDDHKTLLRSRFDESKYKKDVKNWLSMEWFCGKYKDLLSLPDFPSLSKGLSWLSNYDTAVRNWASSKKINIEGPPEQAAVDAWTAQDNRYKEHTAAVEQAEKNLTAWQTTKDSWLAGQQGSLSDNGNLLTLTTQHVDPFPGGSVSNIVSSSTNIVVMPNVSDAASYRSMCQNFTNRLGKSYLICENRCWDQKAGKNVNIAWTRTVYDKMLWTKSEVGLGLGSYSVGDVLRTQTNGADKVTLSRTLANINITDGYATGVYPFAKRSDDGANCGVDSAYTGTMGTGIYTAGGDIETTECGSVILIGTLSHPIRINGPTYIDGDVVLRGFVDGQGTIYAGRNIHIIGDLTYIKPPHWPHSTPGMNKDTPDKVAERNSTKGSLTLVARGNIIVGNYTDPKWLNSCKTWMQRPSTDANYRSSVPCCNDYADDAIGYADFAYDYTKLEGAAEDGNAKIVLEYWDEPYFVDKPKDQNEYDPRFWAYADWVKYLTESNYMVKTYVCDKKKYHMVPTATMHQRCFYECKLGGEVISDLMQQTPSATVTSSSSSLSWLWSSDFILRWIIRSWGGALMLDDVDYQTISYDADELSSAVAKDVNAGDITQIDAILFANHGIFGYVGGSSSHKFKLHGAMICRDEGLLPSFVSRFNTNGSEAWVNWDMRIKSESKGSVVGTGGPGNGKRYLKMTETSWRQTK